MAKKKSESKAVGKQVEAKPKVVHIEPKNGVFFAYANHVEIGSTVFDARLLFGEILSGTEEEIKVLARVQVTVTWMEAKLLHSLLGRVLENREKELGSIQVPPVTPMQDTGERIKTES